MAAGSPATAALPISHIQQTHPTPRASGREAPEYENGPPPRRNDVSWPELRARLGVLPARLWVTLINLRNRKDQVWCGLRWMQQHLDTQERNIFSAIARLESAGLMQTVGTRASKMTKQRKRRPSMLRKVRGKLDEPGGVASVPGATVVWMRKANTWGGKRAGSGRRGNLISTPSERDDGQGVEIKRSGKPPAVEIKSGADRTPSEYEVTVPSQKRGDGGARPGAAMGSSFEERTPTGLGLARPRRPELAGRPDPRSLAASGWIPRYPAIERVGVVQVPPPPLLDPDLSDRELAESLTRTYRGMLEAKFSERSYAFSRGDISNSKFFPDLVDAAKALIDHSIPPAAWASWKAMVWSKFVSPRMKEKGRARLPPIKVVFDSAKIDAQRGFFRKESLAYMGGATLHAPEHVELLKTWELMIDALRRLRSPTWVEAEVRAVAESYFPPGHYEVLFEAAQVWVVEQRAKIRVAAARGDFLW